MSREQIIDRIMELEAMEIYGLTIYEECELKILEEKLDNM